MVSDAGHLGWLVSPGSTFQQHLGWSRHSWIQVERRGVKKRPFGRGVGAGESRRTTDVLSQVRCGDGGLSLVQGVIAPPATETSFRLVGRSAESGFVTLRS